MVASEFQGVPLLQIANRRMDENPYQSPQTTQQSKRWPVGLYFLLAFVVIPVIVGRIWIVYRIVAYGLFLPQH